MGYNLSGRYVNCWSCSKHRLGDTLVQLSGLPWARVKALLGDLPRERAPTLVARGKLELPKGVGPLLPVHETYLRGRGFEPEYVRKVWGVQGIGQEVKLGWRLFIPIVHRGEMVSWTTRSISERSDRRYRSARAEQESVNHKKILYGGDLVRHAAVVHEGPTDVWRTGPGLAVGLCGTGFSQAQVRALARLTRRVVCFDSDTEAQKRARELCDALMVFSGTTVNVVLDAKDSASAEESEVELLRKMIA